MLPKFVKRRVRPLWVMGLMSAAWVNRADMRRWLNFARRSWTQRHERPLAETLTEARARFAITTDPVLRRDRSLDDITVHDGIATLSTRTHPWPAEATHLSRLRELKGISDVVTKPAVR